MEPRGEETEEGRDEGIPSAWQVRSIRQQGGKGLGIIKEREDDYFPLLPVGSDGMH